MPPTPPPRPLQPTPLPPRHPAQDVVKIIDACPRSIFLRLERTIAPRLAFLESLGVGADLGRIIVRFPDLLTASVEGVLEPRVAFLQQALCISREEVGRHPKLLAASEAMVVKRLEFLYGLGLSDDAVVKILKRHPQVLDYSAESMRPRIEFLMHEVGMDEAEVADAVTRSSALFSLSVEHSLRPKIEYLTQELGGSKASLVTFPNYLTLSLAQCIQPRHRFLVEKKQSDSPFKLSKLMLTDQVFAQRAGVQLGDYLAFRADSRNWALAR